MVVSNGVVGEAGSRRQRFGRRGFLGGAMATGLAAWPVTAALTALANSPSSRRVPARYGPLGAPDAHGVRVPAGFRSMSVARTGDVVGSTGYTWHAAPDGGACFAVAGSTDHVYVSNSEVDDGGGGVSAIRMTSSGEIVDAWNVLSGTSRNCAGGSTPWGTWLSCEEDGDASLVWECDPLGRWAVARPAMGRFNHEAAATDAERGAIYLTEDLPDGRLYRFRPNVWGDLTAGVLEAAAVDGDGTVAWVVVSPDGPDRSAATTAFDGGEGLVRDGDRLFVTTKGDRRVWELDLVNDRISILHDAVARPDTALTHVDNITVHPRSHHLFVAEDGGNVELCVVARGAGGDPPAIVPIVQFEGHDGSEVAGPAFSPDGRSLYLSSQRGTDGAGLTVRVDGPFATAGPVPVGGAVSLSPLDRAVRVDTSGR